VRESTTWRPIPSKKKKIHNPRWSARQSQRVTELAENVTKITSKQLEFNKNHFPLHQRLLDESLWQIKNANLSFSPCFKFASIIFQTLIPRLPVATYRQSLQIWTSWGFGTFLAESVASSDEECTKNEQNRVCISYVFYNFHFLHFSCRTRFDASKSYWRKSLN
jgi:hypothetical protein